MTVFHDPVHGPIDLDALPDGGLLARLLDTPLLQRLRRIRQMSTLFSRFTGGEHSRFSHAVGTLAVAAKFWPKIESAIPKTLSFDDPYNHPKIKNVGPIAWLRRHYMAAALLQDVGELPVEPVTKYFFVLDETSYQDAVSLIADVKADLIRQVRPKTLRTISFVKRHIFSEQTYREELDERFLTRLLVGRTVEGSETLSQCLTHLINTLDGVFDVDRVDYVHRDTAAILGNSMLSHRLLDSIKCFEGGLPVLNDAAPAAHFYMQRHSLWETVYYDLDGRYRLSLLFEVLLSVKRSNQAKQAFEAILPFQINASHCDRYVDYTLWDALTAVRDLLDARGREALRSLQATVTAHRREVCREEEAGSQVEVRKAPPDTLFFDVFSDPIAIQLGLHGYRPSYEARKVWVEKSGSRDSLEEIVPTLASIISDRLRPEVICYYPSTFQWPNWLKSLKKQGNLGKYYSSWACGQGFDVPHDTRSKEEFSGPALFISYAWEDVEVVDMIVRFLLDKKQRYYYIRGRFEGIGTNVVENSRWAAKQAEAALIVISHAYIEKWDRRESKPIEAEVEGLAGRVREGDLPAGRVCPVTLGDLSHSSDKVKKLMEGLGLARDHFVVRLERLDVETVKNFVSHIVGTLRKEGRTHAIGGEGSHS